MSETKSLLQIRKVLLPVDFHETSLAVIHLAASIARRFDSDVLLVHVVTPQSYSPYELKQGVALRSEDLLAEILEYADKELHEPIRAALQGLRIKGVVCNGRAPEEIVQLARAESVDLIVMPTHGYHGFYEYLVGSVTAQVIHESDCPVLTAAHLPENPIPVLDVKHVLCGVTFSDHTVQTLKWAADVASEYKAKLTLAHVTPSIEMYGPGGMYVNRSWKDELVAGSNELIAKLQRQVSLSSDSMIDSGDPGQGLSRIATQVGADLLVVGCHDSGSHLGSNGYSILSASRIPVLSV